MSVVLIGPSGSLGRAVLSRLMDQGDDIRVIEDDPAAAQDWKAMGAHVALAREWDADLIERACFGARTMVIFERKNNDDELLSEALRAREPTGVDRLILVRPKPTTPAALARADTDHVVLGTGGGGILKRKSSASDDLVADAVNAADDIEGHPRLVVDLTNPIDLQKLGL